MYRKGTSHYNLSEFADALTAFKEAYRAFEDPVILFNIGQCQRQLGMRSEAVLSYRAFLREHPNAPNAGDVRSLIATLESEIQRERASKAGPPQGTLAPSRMMTPPPVEKPPARPVVAPPAKPAAEPTARPAPKPIEVSRPVPPPSAPSTERTPVYKKWWLWTAVGAVVVAGVAVGLGVGSSSSPEPVY